MQSGQGHLVIGGVEGCDDGRKPDQARRLKRFAAERRVEWRSAGDVLQAGDRETNKVKLSLSIA